MRRRDVVVGLGGVIAAWPRMALAQQQTKPIVGFLSGRSPDESAELVKAFRRGLAETGFTEGSNVTIEFRWADGHYDRLAALAAELVKNRVAAIAAVGGGVSGLAAKTVTSTIPIVFSSGGDAVKIGLVQSLNKPGGNVTGINLIFGALGAKRLEYLRSLVPTATTLGILSNPDYPSAATEVRDVVAGARDLGLTIATADATAERDFEPAFAGLAGQKVAGLIVADDPFLQSRRDQIVGLAARHRMPAVYFSRDFADAGGLMSYGPNIVDAYRLVGVYTARVLKGERPADLPVLQPAKFELVINLKTAKTLGVTIPTSLLATADDVIE
ncbi:ABC transporter substrate-binding protein [Rhodoplanes sp. Z2-YC6860]|uniref:ABC transporter substrate-binding protein n=1 Tax=Rhodoplanes sp. Z2-YC6860 TaxID=674703 RepID=UPI00078C5A24|nr:ABC transporter substrate-binding protein [Rhodoplanes sp. Z2-YC6860]AMN40366.1 ABC-type uncharacterized transport system, periplasmic component [Rhodoplanes sp. Z2-YC6860]